jgi:hypothetical protein
MDDKTKRYILIGLLAVALSLATLLLFGLEPPIPAVLPPVGPAPQATAPTAKAAAPVLPDGAAKVGLPTRDIFSPPAEFATLLPPTGNGAVRGGTGLVAPTGPVPVLTGVIEGSGGRRVAILRQGNISRSYRVGESAGAYRITAIGPRSVTLAGPGGTQVLTMGQ